MIDLVDYLNDEDILILFQSINIQNQKLYKRMDKFAFVIELKYHLSLLGGSRDGIRSWQWIKTKIVHFVGKFPLFSNQQQLTQHTPRDSRWQMWRRPLAFSFITAISKVIQSKIVPSEKSI